MLICYTGTLLILARNWLRNPAGVLANPFSHSPARENTNFLPRRKTALHWMIKLVEDSPMGVAVSFEKQLLFPTTIVCFCLSSISGRRRFPTSETWKKKKSSKLPHFLVELWLYWKCLLICLSSWAWYCFYTVDPTFCFVSFIENPRLISSQKLASPAVDDLSWAAGITFQIFWQQGNPECILPQALLHFFLKNICSVEINLISESLITLNLTHSNSVYKTILCSKKPVRH